MSWRTIGTSNYQNAESLVPFAPGTQLARTKTPDDSTNDQLRRLHAP